MAEQDQNAGSTSKRHPHRKLCADSALLSAVGEMIATFVGQKGATSVAVLLAQVPEMMGPIVLQTIEEMARYGVITVRGKTGSVIVAWNSAQKGDL